MGDPLRNHALADLTGLQDWQSINTGTEVLELNYAGEAR